MRHVPIDTEILNLLFYGYDCLFFNLALYGYAILSWECAKRLWKEIKDHNDPWQT